MAKTESTSAPKRGRDGNLRGYFGIGVERVSKPMNVGNLFRTAHAFGASFVFTVNAHYTVAQAKSDTSLAPKHLPYYSFADVESMAPPQDCSIVGIEIVDGARELPSFRHRNAPLTFWAPSAARYRPRCWLDATMSCASRPGLA